MDHLRDADARLARAEDSCGNVALTHAAMAQVYASLYVGGQLERIADALEQVAPASRNGAGEIVGRAMEVRAALGFDGGGQVAPGHYGA
jgi:hypothetical protein